MKRLLSIIISTLLLMTLVACTGSGSGTGSKTGSAPSESSAAGSSKSDEKDSGAANETGSKTLTVWCWDPAFNIYAMEEAEKIYQKENPDFKLEIIETPWDDLQTKLITAASSGALDTLPDIFLMQNYGFQKNVQNYPEIFTELTDGGISYNDFPESVVSYSKMDGKNYGVPFDNGTVVQALRLDVLKEAGYTVEDFTDITWDKYIELGKDILEKTGKPIMSETAGSARTVSIMLQSCGSSLFNDDGSLNITANKELPEIMRLYKEMVDSGILLLVNSWDEYITTFVSGSVAGTINGCWILGSVQTAEDQSGLWSITNLPKIDGIDTATNYSASGGSSWAISSNCKDIDLAIDFLSKTFVGSVPFYETILSSSGAIANYIPASQSKVYQEPQAFFNNEPIYARILEYSEKVPSNNPGVYYYEADAAMAVAVTEVINGTDIEAAIKEAENTISFDMGQ